MYKYVGVDAYYPGVPKRDLTDDEWDALPKEAKRVVKDLYKKVEIKKKEE